MKINLEHLSEQELIELNRRVVQRLKSLEPNFASREIAEVPELKYQKRQLELVIKNTGLGICDWHVQTGETLFNERWANIIGYTLEELYPMNIETWMKYAHPGDLEKSDSLLKEHWAGKTEYYIFESRMKHRNGTWIWVYDTGQVIEWETDGVPKRMIRTHLDITDQKQSQIKLDESNQKLKEWSYLDSLTKIPNRRAYDDKLESEISAAKRTKTSLSLLVIDIDSFKEYNDHYGHQKGDIALCLVTKLITDALPRKTDFVARYGGEEFVVILPYTPLNGAVFAAQQILQRITSDNIEHPGSKFQNILTISIGIASTDTYFDELLTHADKAVYQAKRNGRNRYETYTQNLVGSL